MIDRVSDALRTRMNNGCTGCRYCMPCPAGVDIPLNFHVWNEYGVLRTKAGRHGIWETLFPILKGRKLHIVRQM